MAGRDGPADAATGQDEAEPARPLVEAAYVRIAPTRRSSPSTWPGSGARAEPAPARQLDASGSALAVYDLMGALIHRGSGSTARPRIEFDGRRRLLLRRDEQRATARGAGNCGTGVAEKTTPARSSSTATASQSAGASGAAGLLVVRAARGALRDSLQGTDSSSMARSGTRGGVHCPAGHGGGCGDAGDDLGDSIYEARVDTFAARSRAWAPTGSRRKLGHEHLSRAERLLNVGGRPLQSRRLSLSTAPPASCIGRSRQRGAQPMWGR